MAAIEKAFTYAKLRRLALSLKLPNVVEAISWGQPTLKAYDEAQAGEKP